MAAQSIELTYKRHTIRVAIEPSGAWLRAEDVGEAIGAKAIHQSILRIPDHEKTLLQIAGKGPRVRVLSPDGVRRIAGANRAPRAMPFLKWFLEQGLPVLGEAVLERQEDAAGREAEPEDLALVVSPSEPETQGGVRAFQFEAVAVRTQMDRGEILFNANDVCQALDMSNPWQAIATHVDAEDLQKMEALTAGGTQQVNFVNLSGLYALIFGSTKDSARRFKRWVTHEVLPSIQKTGSYSLHSSQDVEAPKLSSLDLNAQQMLTQASNLSGLMQALPLDQAERAKHEETQRLAHEVLTVFQAEAEKLKRVQLRVTFERGVDHPKVLVEIPQDAPINSTAADKDLGGRRYVLDFSSGVDRPRLRPFAQDEHLLKANLLGVKYLANQARFGLDEWLDLEKLMQYKVRAERNRR